MVVSGEFRPIAIRKVPMADAREIDVLILASEGNDLQQRMDVGPPGELFADFPMEGGLKVVVLGLHAAAGQHPVRGPARADAF